MSYKPSKIIILREAITKVTQILAGKRIAVVQQGMSAKVEYDPRTNLPVKVYLPMLPDNASDELCDAIQGFLDHEVAHILFSDAATLISATKRGKSFASINNMLEDAFIERKMSEAFRGCGPNLQNTGRFYLNNFVKPNLKKAKDGGDMKEELSVMMPTIMRALSGQFIFKEALDAFDSDAARQVFAKIEHLAGQAEKCQTSADVLKLTEDVIKCLSDNEKPQDGDDGDESEQQGNQSKNKGKNKDKNKGKNKDKSEQSEGSESEDGEPSEGEGGEGSEGEGSEGEGSEGDKKDKKDKKDKGGQGEESEGEESEGEGGSDGEGEDSDEEGEGDSQGDSQGGEGEDGDSQDGGNGDPNDSDSGDGFGQSHNDQQGGKGAGQTNGRDGEFQEFDREGDTGVSWEDIAAAASEAANFDDAAGEAVGDAAAKAAKTADYLPFSTERDIQEPLYVPAGSKDRALDQCNKQIEAPVSAMVGPMQKELERAIAARNASILVGGHRSGKLHSASLTRLKFNDDRVFRRREEHNTKDVAVQLVIDVSGSMSGYKVLAAAQAAFALSSVLERIRVKHEVICFTTGDSLMNYSDVEEARQKGILYTRVEQIVMPVVKNFDEPLNSEVRARFGWLPNGIPMQCNIDGESIEYAARRLMKRKATRHVMIVLSDGAPAGHTMDNRSGRDVFSEDLKRRVTKLEAAGVEIAAIGIMDASPKRFYKRASVLNDINALSGTVIKELRSFLVPQ